MARSSFQFCWDPIKEKANRSKHGVDFNVARGVFRDPLATTIPDPEHSDAEDRCVTIGEAPGAGLFVVVHTYREVGPAEAEIRIISARRPDKREQRDYEGGRR